MKSHSSIGGGLFEDKSRLPSLRLRILPVQVLRGRGVVSSVVKSSRIWRSHRARPHAVRFGIADKLSLAQIEL
jgi:hypothetical protein